MHYIIAVHVSGSEGERHITSVRWLNTGSGLSKTSLTGTMVDWLEKGNEAFVGGEHGRAEVTVVRPNGRAPYLRSLANGQWTDNLLRLPRF